MPKSRTATKRVRSKEDKISEVLEKRTKERSEVINNIMAQNQILAKNINDGDSVDLFFNSIATTVKKLPIHAINEAKFQILSFVSQLEEQYLVPSTIFPNHGPLSNYNFINPWPSQISSTSTSENSNTLEPCSSFTHL